MDRNTKHKKAMAKQKEALDSMFEENKGFSNG